MAETDVDRLSRIMLAEFHRVHERFDQIDENFSGLSSEVSSIHRRLAALEDAVGNITGFAKEIDHLLSRVAAIEKHLGLTGHIKGQLPLARRGLCEVSGVALLSHIL